MMTWMKIETAPFDRDLEVAVIEANGDTYAVIFPCHRVLSGWTEAATGGHVEFILPIGEIGKKGKTASVGGLFHPSWVRGKRSAEPTPRCLR